MNIQDFLQRISEMGPIAVFFDTPTSSGNAGGGFPKNLSNYAVYEETIEIFLENDDKFNLKKANIQSIDYQENCVTVVMTDG